MSSGVGESRPLEQDEDRRRRSETEVRLISLKTKKVKSDCICLKVSMICKADECVCCVAGKIGAPPGWCWLGTVWFSSKILNHRHLPAG